MALYSFRGQIVVTCMLSLVLLNFCSCYFINEWAVHIRGGERVARDVARKHGFTYVEKVFPDSDYYVFEHPDVEKRSTEHDSQVHARLKRETQVIRAEQQYAKIRQKRDLKSDAALSDPLWSKQWYLHHGAFKSFDMNVMGAWRKGYTGKGISVSILDDGIEKDHPDLAANYDELASTDINGRDPDPQPRYDITNENKHGTRCAGEVAAVANNTICGVGIAHGAKIGGVRMLDGDVTDKVEALSLSLRPNHIDIYSASWGPDDNGKVVDGPAMLAKKAFIDGVTKGRKGKGNIFVWASGNGGRNYDSCNCDGYTNSIYTLSVSSVTEQGTKPWYLEECSSTIASTYSSGNSMNKQIITTDLHHRCTQRHTGTSASAPLAAGVCALTLEANPSLTWRDMQHIVVMTAKPDPIRDGNWVTNGVGRKVSSRYGYGLMDTSAMVDLAEKWVPVPEQHICTVEYPSGNKKMVGQYLELMVDTDGCSSDKTKAINYLEHVQAKVSLTYKSRGDLQIELTSPQGTTSVILPKRARDSQEGIFDSWPFMSTQFWGEYPTGKWRIKFINTGKSYNSGIINTWELVLHGTTENPIKLVKKSPTPPTTLPVRHRGDSHEKYLLSTSTKPPITTGKPGWGWLFGGNKTPPPNPIETTADPSTESHATTTESMTTTVECHQECQNGCTGGRPEDCRECKHFRMGGKTGPCVSECNDGEYHDLSGFCLPCDSTCSNCTAGTANDCLACPKGKFYNEEEGTCLDACIPGTYTDTLDNTCKDCDTTCKTCDVSAANCLGCHDNAVLFEHQCRAKCRDEEFRDADGSCKQCDLDCESCRGPSSTDCLVCASNLYNQSGTCVSECSESFYVDARTCAGCDVSCLSCQGPRDDQCKACRRGIDLKDGKCQRSEKVVCQQGEYQSHGGRCSPCWPSCQSCSGQREDECLTCQPGKYSDEGECVETCYNGFFKQEVKNREGVSVRRCSPCHATCRTCNSSSSTDCVSCSRGKQVSKGRCITKCEEGEFSDRHGRCQTCHTSCLQCSGTQDTDCTECEVFKFLFHGRCLEHCPKEHFEQKGQCLRCHHSCETCSGPGRRDCLSCDSKHYLKNDACLRTPRCLMDQYFDELSSECQNCDKSCATCHDSGPNSCATCRQSKTLYSGKCTSCCVGENLVGCCNCDASGMCLKAINQNSYNDIKLANTPSKQKVRDNHAWLIGFIVTCCVLIVVLFFVVFGLLQAKSNNKLCWKDYSYQKLPVRFDTVNTNTLLLTREDFEDEDDLQND